MKQERRRRWVTVLMFIGLFAAIMLVISTRMMAGWSELSAATAVEASVALDEARAALTGPAYIEISEDGTVRVRRDLEGQESHDLEALQILAWDPGRARLLSVRVPYWYARAKMSRAFDLGTLITFLVRDWDNLSLRVDEASLEARGPGLLLDYTAGSGRRILLWSE